MSTNKLETPSVLTPPTYCEYSDGVCDNTFKKAPKCDGFFVYPSDPEIFAATIEEAISKLNKHGGAKYLSWKDIGIQGQIVFCRICTALRFAKFIVADVTTLNFNLLFEIGYAIGLNQLVMPIRDTSYLRDVIVFDELWNAPRFNWRAR